MSQKSFSFSDVSQEIRKLCEELQPQFNSTREQLSCVCEGFQDFIQKELTAIYMSISMSDNEQQKKLYQRIKIIQAIKTSLAFQRMILTENGSAGILDQEPMKLVSGN